MKNEIPILEPVGVASSTEGRKEGQELHNLYLVQSSKSDVMFFARDPENGSLHAFVLNRESEKLRDLPIQAGSPLH